MVNFSILLYKNNNEKSTNSPTRNYKDNMILCCRNNFSYNAITHTRNNLFGSRFCLENIYNVLDTFRNDSYNENYVASQKEIVKLKRNISKLYLFIKLKKNVLQR